MRHVAAHLHLYTVTEDGVMVLIVRTADLSSSAFEFIDHKVDGWSYEHGHQPAQSSYRDRLQAIEEDEQDGPVSSLEIDSFDEEVDI